MKRKILLLTSLILSALPIALAAQMTYVPDDNFEQALINLGLDTPPLNDSIPTKNIDTLTYLYLHSKEISYLTGIEDFKALTYLNCVNNKLTSVNLTNNTALIHLNCYSNKLTSLDVSNNIALTYLYCGNNSLTSLDESSNIVLTKLDCAYNRLTSLDVSKNTALTYLTCSYNSLTSLDVSTNTALNELYCNTNDLKSLNVSKNTALSKLYCNTNDLKSLNVSKNTALSILFCSENMLTNLDVTNNTPLTELICFKNKLTSLDLSNNIYLNDLHCFYNQDLFCIQVADSTKAANNSNFYKDPWAHYSENCDYTAVDDNKFENEAVAISPNPAQDYIEITKPSEGLKPSEGYTVLIYNILGEIVSGLDTPPDPLFLEGDIVRLDVSHLSPGVYFVRVGDIVRKFVKI